MTAELAASLDGEVELSTMASRPCPGLYLCGEILDVDGRIGRRSSHAQSFAREGSRGCSGSETPRIAKGRESPGKW